MAKKKNLPKYSFANAKLRRGEWLWRLDDWKLWTTGNDNAKAYGLCRAYYCCYYSAVSICPTSTFCNLGKRPLQ